jgi:hypothetical protein
MNRQGAEPEGGGALGRAACNRRCRSTRRGPVTSCPPCTTFWSCKLTPTAGNSSDRGRRGQDTASWSSRHLQRQDRSAGSSVTAATGARAHSTSSGGRSRTAPPLARTGRTYPSVVRGPAHCYGPWRMIVGRYNGSHLRTIALRPRSPMVRRAPSMRVTGTGDPLLVRACSDLRPARAALADESVALFVRSGWIALEQVAHGRLQSPVRGCPPGAALHDRYVRGIAALRHPR